MESKMVDLKWLNNYFKNLSDLRVSKFFIEKQVTHEVNDNNEEQGVNGEWFEIYRLPDEENEIYLRLKITTDSYGQGESIEGIEFVVPKVKNVTIFEEIK